mgnify:CR=1 FL=1
MLEALDKFYFQYASKFLSATTIYFHCANTNCYPPLTLSTGPIQPEVRFLQLEMYSTESEMIGNAVSEILHLYTGAFMPLYIELYNMESGKVVEDGSHHRGNLYFINI